ncbi:MAG: NADP-dependent oxidoreductase [Tistlia sp.]|uniref:NADP-dependent oxidoreductase n=1 Tax=Tistlia sp. TaxID=3057121 RepID=UPI0034A55842
MSGTNRRIVLAERPGPGGVTEDCFRLEVGDTPRPAPGQLLIRNLYLSCEPAQRGWIAAAANYAEPVPIGGVMRSFALGQVVESDDSHWPAGSLVYGRFGWQDWHLSDGSDIDRRCHAHDGPLEINLHLLGLTGLTAYLALTEIGRPRAGETVAVSTAAGAVGSVAGQVAKILGCRTVGFTGSTEKVRACLDEFGYDAAIDYRRAGDLEAALKAAAPEGIDVYYDNTAGPVSDAVMTQLRTGARIAQVGTMAIPSHPVPEGPRPNRAILVARATLTGFLAFDWRHKFDEAAHQLAIWHKEGRIRTRHDVAEGIERAPAHLVRLLRGENDGKALVHLTDPM